MRIPEGRVRFGEGGPELCSGGRGTEKGEVEGG